MTDPVEPDAPPAAKACAPAAVEAPALPPSLRERALAELERMGVTWCLLHGCEPEPDGDVDLIVSAHFLGHESRGGMAELAQRLGCARVLHLRDAADYVVFIACEAGDGIAAGSAGGDGAPPQQNGAAMPSRASHGGVPPEVLALHLHADVEVRGRLLMGGAQLLAGRRREGDVWVPAPDDEFAAVLGTRLAKAASGGHPAPVLSRGRSEGRRDASAPAGATKPPTGSDPSPLTSLAAQVRRGGNCAFEPRHGRRLATLVVADPGGCERVARAMLPANDAERIIEAATSRRWDDPEIDLPRLGRFIMRQAAKRHPLHLLRRRAMSGGRRAARLARPGQAGRGLSVVVLGPDGSGKSSVVEAVASRLGPAFSGVERRSFPPALRQWPDTVTRSHPQAAPPRSPVSSAVRATAYWGVHAWLAHLGVIGPKLVNNRLILHDRHLMDTLIDQKRYRYSGPTRLLRWIVAATPRPGLVILLDAPAEVVQARKGELTLDETRRQLEAYRKLVGSLSFGTLVDADASLGVVVQRVEAVIVEHMGRRVESGV